MTCVIPADSLRLIAVMAPPEWTILSLGVTGWRGVGLPANTLHRVHKIRKSCNKKPTLLPYPHLLRKCILPDPPIPQNRSRLIWESFSSDSEKIIQLLGLGGG